MKKKVRGFEVVENWARKNKEVIMPLRKTKYSAGYDFLAPYSFDIMPDETVVIVTDIKVYMLPDEYLKIVPRSSLGMKKDTIIKNLVGVIDYDYYNNSSTGGNIKIGLKNIGEEPQYFEKEEGLVQGIFTKYLVADNCNVDEVRKGGIGSTNK